MLHFAELDGRPRALQRGCGSRGRHGGPRAPVQPLPTWLQADRHPPSLRGKDSAAPQHRMPSGSITDVPAGLTGGGGGGGECGSLIV